jgi:glycosyltransferase involved in cell wall biosynthesis
MEVAYFSPLPPERSGVADYSALLLPALRRRLPVRVVRRGHRADGSSVCLYHLGNDPNAHGWIVDALERRPGVVVLHEVALHELFASLALARGEVERYLDAVEREGGAAARRLARLSLAGLAPPLWETRPLELPLLSAVLRQAEAVIVHSRFAAERVRGAGYTGPVTRIPMPAPQGSARSVPVEPRPVICSAGIVNWTKRIPQLLAAFALLRRRFPDAVLLLVGPGAAGLNLPARLEQLGLQLGRDVLDLGYVEEPRLVELMAASTVCVGLRWPTLGETSASVVRALTLGRPTVVTEAGWFAELPGSVAAKIPLGGDLEVEHLAAVLELLCADESLRARMGAAAREYASREHNLDDAADAYAAALRQAA